MLAPADELLEAAGLSPPKGLNVYEPLKCGCGAPLHIVCSKDAAHPHEDFETPSARKARVARHVAKLTSLSRAEPAPRAPRAPRAEPRTSTVVYKGPGICTYLDCTAAIEPKPAGVGGRPRTRCPKHSTFMKHGR